MRPICVDEVTAEQLSELDELYQTTHDARVRIRALMVLLAAERQMVAAQIASLLRQHEETVRRGNSALPGRRHGGSLRCASLGCSAKGDACLS